MRPNKGESEKSDKFRNPEHLVVKMQVHKASAVTNHAAQLAIIKHVTRQESRSSAAIVMQMSRQESRSSAGPDHVTLQALITWLIKYRSRD